MFLTEARFDDEKVAGDSYHSVFGDDIFAVSGAPEHLTPRSGSLFRVEPEKGTRAAQWQLFRGI